MSWSICGESFNFMPFVNVEMFLQRHGELDGNTEIECRLKRLYIMLINLELLCPKARSLVSPLLDSTKSILSILKSDNTNCDKKCFQISVNHLINLVHQNLTSLNMLMYYLEYVLTIPNVSAC